MTRLPTPGSDSGSWGDILNNFLEVAHNPDGSLANNTVGTNQIKANAVTNTQLDSSTQASLAKANSSVQTINNKSPNGSGAVTLAASDLNAIDQTTADSRYIQDTAKGAANGVATLDGSSKLTSGQLPGGVVSDASLRSIVEYGAVAGSDILPAVTAALAALPTDPTLGYPMGTIFYPAGTWQLHGAIPFSGPFVTHRGEGKEKTVITCYSSVATNFFSFESGLTVGQVDASAFTEPRGYFGTKCIDGMTIDGTNAAGGSAGLQIGSVETTSVGDDILIRYFQGVGSVGCLIGPTNSTDWWTEKVYIPMMTLFHNTRAVQIGTLAKGELSYSDLSFVIYALPNQDGVVVTNGAGFFHGSLRVRGNFTSGASNTGAILRITGNAGAAYSAISESELDFKVECNHGPGGVVTHQSVAFGTPGSNFILSCYGTLLMDFGAAGNPQPTNYNPALGSYFGFTGLISGDSVLNPSGAVLPISTTHVIPAKGFFDSATNSLDLKSGDFFDIGALTATKPLLFANGLAAPGRIKVRVTQSGSPFYTITWPYRVSPTITNPTVRWPGGVLPVVSQVAGAVDDFELWTTDGVTWDGQQLANMIAPTPIIPPPMGAVGVSAARAYGVRKLITGYAGNCLRVRRDSDNTTLDIGFVANGDLDAASLLTFVGAGSGFVNIWYDQSGNTHHLTQATAANQPLIVSLGALNIQNNLPGLTFNGTSHILGDTSPGMFASGSASALIVERALSGGTGYAFNESRNATSASTYIFAGQSSNDLFMQSRNDAGTIQMSEGVTGLNAINTKLRQVSFVDTGTVATHWIAGATATNSPVTYTRGTTTLTNFSIGATINSSDVAATWANAFVSEALFFYASLTTGQRQAGEANQASYFATS